MLYTLSDVSALLNGLEATLIGVGVVFLMLGVLICCVKLMSIGKKKQKQPDISTEPTVSLPAPAENMSDVFTDDEGNELKPEIVAAIVAAITVMMSGSPEEGRPSIGFKVRKITQIK